MTAATRIASFLFAMTGTMSASTYSQEGPPKCPFDEEQVKQLIDTAEVLDQCFVDDDKTCRIKEKPLEEQAELNKLRLVPVDRRSGDGFLDRATGQVTITFGRYNGSDSLQTFTASAQKISRCHIITSAHLLYSDGAFPLNSNNFEILFRYGQSCDPHKPFLNQNIVSSVRFKMTDESKHDFGCIADEDGPCGLRKFLGHSDIVILRLKDFDSKNGDFFQLSTTDPNSYPLGQRVTCWGYPGWTASIGLSETTSRMLLWQQRDAQIFGDNNGEFAKGVLTNAVSYKGMSGGGCIFAKFPRTLIGLYSKDNKSTGIPVIDISDNRGFASNDNWKSANYLSAFGRLNARFRREVGSDLSTLDKECE